jgi:hypothetical protein
MILLAGEATQNLVDWTHVGDAFHVIAATIVALYRLPDTLCGYCRLWSHIVDLASLYWPSPPLRSGSATKCHWNCWCQWLPRLGLVLLVVIQADSPTRFYHGMTWLWIGKIERMVWYISITTTLLCYEMPSNHVFLLNVSDLPLSSQPCLDVLFKGEP